MMAQGILHAIAGVVVGKPYNEKYYEEYKEVLVKVLSGEAGRPDLPVLYNVNFGYCAPTCILPYGALAEIDCETRAFTLLESGVMVG